MSSSWGFPEKCNYFVNRVRRLGRLVHMAGDASEIFRRRLLSITSKPGTVTGRADHFRAEPCQGGLEPWTLCECPPGVLNCGESPELLF